MSPPRRPVTRSGGRSSSSRHGGGRSLSRSARRRIAVPARSFLASTRQSTTIGSQRSSHLADSSIPHGSPSSIRAGRQEPVSTRSRTTAAAAAAPTATSPPPAVAPLLSSNTAVTTTEPSLTPTVQYIPTRGDRSHPELVELDSLQLSYPHWQQDFANAEDAHFNNHWNWDNALHKLKVKQKMYQGDRSHPRLVALDALELNYQGWRADVGKVEAWHMDHEYPFMMTDSCFQRQIEELCNKQRQHAGDRSHPELVELDALQLTYPQWQQDFATAEDAHFNRRYDWDNALHKLKEKQKVHQGDRSHPRLAALDALQLNYPGWCGDVDKLQEWHFDHDYPYLFSDSWFQNQVEGLRNKQRRHEGDRSHPELVELDSLQLTYPQWHQDFAHAENAHFNSRSDWDNALHKLKEKQKVHQGDRSHPRLAVLDALRLDYPGWRSDVAKAEEWHFNFEYPYMLSDSSFQRRVDEINNKQRCRGSGRSQNTASGTTTSNGRHVVVPGAEASTREEDTTTGQSRTAATGHRAKATEVKSSTDSGAGDDAPPGICVICLEQPVSRLFLPCRHLCTCDHCGQQLFNASSSPKCPICRARANQALQVFIS